MQRQSSEVMVGGCSNADAALVGCSEETAEPFGSALDLPVGPSFYLHL